MFRLSLETSEGNINIGDRVVYKIKDSDEECSGKVCSVGRSVWPPYAPYFDVDTNPTSSAINTDDVAYVKLCSSEI